MKQRDQLLLETLVEIYGPGLLLEQFSSKGNKMKIIKMILAGVISGALLSSIMSTNYFTPKEKAKIETAVDSAKIEKTLTPEDTIPNYRQKIEAVNDYMLKAVENNGFDVKAIKITPESIVLNAHQYGFDIPLALAQAHQESCFGMTPRAKRTNSIFSVGLWDNGHNKNTYATQDESVGPYMQLINQDYLQNGKKKVSDLLIPGGFVNYAGDRYASDRKYENNIRYLRNKIIREYPVLADNNHDIG